MALSARDVIEILQTLDRLGYRRFRYEHDGTRLEVDTTTDGEGGATTPATASIAGGAATAAPAAVKEPVSAAVAAETPPAAPPREGLVGVECPMTGTFYRAPAPDAPPFVEVGGRVGAGDTVCLVDVMKLFTSVPAGVAGTVVEICAENEARVEAGQPLMWIDPEG